MRKIAAVLFGILFLLIGGSIGVYKLMNSRDFQVAGELLQTIQTKEKVIYLTFDDGPTKETSKIIDLLNELNIKATFFLIGDLIDENREETKLIVENGHDIGNHTYSHQRMIFKSPSFVREEVDHTNALIRNIGYEKEIFFRPPFGKKLVALPLYLEEIKQTTVMWDVEPESFEEVSKTPEEMANYVKGNVKKGSIILLHPMNDPTGKVLDSIRLMVKELQTEGYTFKLISESY